jgi:hypothetical protein
MSLPEYIKSTSVQKNSTNGLEIYFSGVSPGIYQSLALIYSDPPSYYGNLDSYDWVLPSSISYESGGTVASLTTTIGFYLKGHTSRSGTASGYSTVSFYEKIPLVNSGKVHLTIQLPSWAAFSGEEVGYLIRVE